MNTHIQGLCPEWRTGVLILPGIITHNKKPLVIPLAPFAKAGLANNLQYVTIVLLCKASSNELRGKNTE